MTGSTPTFGGGCACGALRYRLRSAPFDSGYCHCGICRRCSGAPVVVYATVPIEDFALVSGQPRRYRSTSFGERFFCGDCGTPLWMRVDHEPDTLDVTVASLDRPETAPPGFHIWHEARIDWFDVRDALPRHARSRNG